MTSGLCFSNEKIEVAISNIAINCRKTHRCLKTAKLVNKTRFTEYATAFEIFRHRQKEETIWQRVKQQNYKTVEAIPTGLGMGKSMQVATTIAIVL